MLIYSQTMNVLDRLNNEVRNLRLAISSRIRRQPSQIKNDVPYVCQFARPKFAEQVLRDGADLIDEPNWADTGADSANEYAQWTPALCGMACTAMALEYFKGKSYKPAALAKDAKLHDVYVKEGSSYSGMRYREFATWIQNYGVNADIYTRLTIRGIQKLLTDEKLVIVSVNPNIRGYNTAKTTQRGGHLVLITGYDKDAFTLHNPSGFASLNSQSNHTISTSAFRQFYAGRGIAIAGLDSGQPVRADI